MKKKYVKIIIALILLVVLVYGALFVKDFFFSSDEKVIYGTRLKGISKHKISEETKNNVKEALKEGTSKVEVRISGKIIYIVMKVNEGTTVEAAKALGIKSLESFTEDEKGYYDVQIMIDSEGENEKFPIIGYKHHLKSNVSWTKDR